MSPGTSQCLLQCVRVRVRKGYKKKNIFIYILRRLSPLPCLFYTRLRRDPQADHKDPTTLPLFFPAQREFKFSQVIERSRKMTMTTRRTTTMLLLHGEVTSILKGVRMQSILGSLFQTKFSPVFHTEKKLL